MLALMRGDFARTVEECTLGRPIGRLRRAAHLAVPSAFCALVFRFAQYLHARDWHRAAAVVTLCNKRLCGVVLHPASSIGPGLFVPHPAGVTFCGRAGAGLTLYPMAYVAPDRFPGWRASLAADWPTIGENVRVGTYGAVMGGVVVGDRSMVGVQVVLRTDLAAGLAASVRPNWRVGLPAGDGPDLDPDADPEGDRDRVGSGW